jgi:hypothetical protein
MKDKPAKHNDAACGVRFFSRAATARQRSIAAVVLSGYFSDLPSFGSMINVAWIYVCEL